MCSTPRRRLAVAAGLLVVLLAGLAPPPAAAVTSWTLARAMRVPRYRHTATLLPDGRLLVAGGNNVTNSETDSVEIYDAATNRWMAAAPLATPRVDHTATLLASARVLVAGGAGWDTAEEYDPQTDTWTSVEPMSVSRRHHTATLLRDGRVLVVGGQDGWGDTTEIYDPVTRTWKEGPPLSSARFKHTATLLLDSRVLVCGGKAPGTFESRATCEILDPASPGAWIPGPTLPEPLSEHSATLLPDGSVLAACGAAGNAYRLIGDTWTAAGTLAEVRRLHSATLLRDGRVLASAGIGTKLLSTTEIYDPALNTWTPGPDLAEGRYQHTSTILADGRVLVAGGWALGAINGPRGSTEVSDRLTTFWSPTDDMPAPTYVHSATLLPDGRVLSTGGNAGTTAAYLYDPPNGTWTPLFLSMNVARSSHRATLLPSGDVLVTGGASDWSPSAEIRRLSSGVWNQTPSMVHGVRHHSATLLADGRVLLAGGQESTFQSVPAVQIFDTDAETWASGAPLGQARQRHAAILLADGTVLVAGGEDDSLGQLASVEIYDPLADAWRDGPPMYEPRSRHTVTRLVDGRLLVVGGSGTSSFLASTEVYDPASATWASGPPLSMGRADHTATLLPDGRVMIVGGQGEDGPLAAIEIYDPPADAWSLGPPLSSGRWAHTATRLLDDRVLVAGGITGGFTASSVLVRWDDPGMARPTITSALPMIVPGLMLSITGLEMGGGPESNDGGTRNSAANFPIVRVAPLAGGGAWPAQWLPRAGFRADQMTLDFDPPGLDRGWHLITVTRAGVSSLPRMVRAGCGVSVRSGPDDATVPPGSLATFAVDAAGGRRFQWQACDTGACPEADWVDLPGATAATHVTGPVAPQDSGRQFRVRVYGSCAPPPPQTCASRPDGCVTSAPARLTVVDTRAPGASVVSPSGGEYWQLGSAQLVTWSMSDDVRICRVEARLLYSNDGGVSYAAVPAAANLDPGQPDGTAAFGEGGTCTLAQQVAVTSLAYQVPATPPSGQSGSLYKVEVKVIDHAGLATTALSANPFYIVQSNPDSVRTLVLHNVSRMDVDPETEADLRAKLVELSNHPRVQGFVVDLGPDTDVGDLYAAWDAEPGNASLANRVLFGCHSPCEPERDGIHDRLRQLLSIYTGVKYVVLVGDDQVIPFARVRDDTTLLPETSYAPSADLTAASTVGSALAGDSFLTDDAVAVMDAVSADGVAGTLFIPDLAVGRLVETAAEITRTIATFISQDGVLDVAALGATGNKVLVTGYDFLADSARRSADRWLAVFPTDPGATAPVDSDLVGGNWGSSVAERQEALRTKLSGNGSSRFALMNLNGHANHYGEGVPGTSPFDIAGLSASEIATIDLAGGVIYAVGCHAGLPVPGSDPEDDDHSLDLPQTFLSRGVVSYVANTGYGWGLKFGVGYGERLMEILTEELSKGGTVATGDAVKRTKLRYFLETPRYDVYDQKSLMQWALFGLPMYAVKTGIPTGGTLTAMAEGALATLRSKHDDDVVEWLGPVKVQRSAIGGGLGLTDQQSVAALSTLPPYLTQLTLHFDLSAEGVYTKRSAAGDELEATPGCPESAADGCYYTLNSLVERSTGPGDLPIQPYLIYDSRLSGTSQHGVLWKGGTYDQETGWRPVIGELVSNVGGGENHGNTPISAMIRPTAPRVVPGQDSETCRPSDLEVNSLVVSAGEAVRSTLSATYDIQRTYREVDLEVFYFNNTVNGQGNCDRTGPDLAGGFAGGAYHELTVGGLQWAVAASDGSNTSEVWRVLVVSTERTDGAGQGTWTPQELTNDGTGTWRGSRGLGAGNRVTYVIQAVDRRGNVSWVDYVTTPEGMPSSGIPHGLPLTVEVQGTNVPRVRGDFDGDGRSDVAVYQPSTGTFTVQQSGGGTTTQVLGRAGFVPVSGDFDGDGRADHAVYYSRRRVWLVRQSGSGTVLRFTLGGPSAAPVAADYDGDGRTDVAVYDTQRGKWSIRSAATGLTTARTLGMAGDLPQPGDYDGDGKADLAVFRPATAGWIIQRSSDDGTTTATFGLTGDRPVARDYDGDGKADLAVYRGGSWIVRRSSDGATTTAVLGTSSDQSVPADYDGDGKADFAAYNPVSGVWTMKGSETGSVTTTTLGGTGFLPVF